MNEIKLTTKASYLWQWGKLLSMTGAAQVLVQGSSLVGGILVIRLLPASEYALYTLANTLLGSMVVLADSGIGAGVMAQGGKVWQNPSQLGAVVATGLKLRLRLAVGSLVLALPLLAYLLLHHGASALMTTLIVLALIPAFFAALSDTLWEVAPKLHQRVKPLQKNQLAVSSGRLVLTALTLFTCPWTFVALLANGLPRLWGNKQLKALSGELLDLNQTPDPAVQKELLGMVKRILPYTLYYCVSGQITIWLLSFLGSTASIARIGALDRLSVVVTVFSTLFTTLISPRFARLTGDRSQLFRHFLRIQLGLLVVAFCTIAGVRMAATPILWVLGPEYAGLEGELTLNMTGNCLNWIAGSTYALYSSRGWAMKPLVSIPLSLIPIVAGTWFLEVGTLLGVITLNVCIACVQVCVSLTYSCFKISQIPRQTDPAAF